uniref:SAM-dependent MTase RsmB/NOP-type domain-containing protein n=1 Tax=Corethron hystrix TaxID=216773 RepID=A0A7S1FVD3_9STRA|mmetsp:Transcript_34954/g.80835  ORF Transcript_34954/g.80835 Transcript_34954/m.80835 type:complete len:347 (+) Transcript_34954:302-1342(+)
MIKFVNFVLREITRQGGSDLLGTTSHRDNVSPSLLKSWDTFYGQPATDAIVDQFMTEPPLELSTSVNPKELAPTFGEEAIVLPHGTVRIGTGHGLVSSLPGYDEGTWWVQSASAAVPALVLSAYLSRRTDGNGASAAGPTHVVDVCAAPGGKTAQLVSERRIGRVTAVERSARRSRRLRENLDRLRMADRCAVVVEDGTEWTPPSSEGGGGDVVHGVLLDVPCSATGTAARRPDVLWTGGATPDELLDTQLKLARHCLENILGSGGVLVYATCSLQKEEGEYQILKLLKELNEQGTIVKTSPIENNEIPGFDDAIDENGWLRVVPGQIEGDLGMVDGFFVARLVKL